MAKNKNNVSRATYSVKEAATVLGMGADAIYDAVHRGDVPHVRIGGKILIPRARLDQMLLGECTANQGDQYERQI